jgi:phage antirepressor YoqD-like protein
MHNSTLSVADLRHRAGLMSIGEVAALLGFTERRFRYLLESARIFRPQTRIGTRRRAYYTASEIRKIRRLIQTSRTTTP